MRYHYFLFVIPILILLGNVGDAQSAERAIGVMPLAQVVPERYGKQMNQSYGVFVGVNDFDDSSIAPLKYAAADARAVRDCLVNELGYLPATHARLLVSGAKGDDRPTRANILKAILDAAQSAGPAGCVVVHISTHGIEGYTLGEDSQRALLQDTAVPLARVKEILSGSPCPRRLLFFDACREKMATDGTKSLGGTMSPAFAQAFAGAHGFAVMMSCSEGQLSHEMEESGQGVFTHFLLAGLRGGAPSAEGGLITVTSLAPWVKAQVETWSKGRRGGVQSPLFTLQDASGDLPLAVSRAGLGARQQLAREQLLRKLAALLAEGKITADQFMLAQGALEGGDPNALKVLEDLVNGEVSPRYLSVLIKKPVTAEGKVAATDAGSVNDREQPVSEEAKLTDDHAALGRQKPTRADDALSEQIEKRRSNITIPISQDAIINALKDFLHATDEEWGVLDSLLQPVLKEMTRAQLENIACNLNLARREEKDDSPEFQELDQVLKDESATHSQVMSKLTAYRAARKAKNGDQNSNAESNGLTSAQQKLLGVLTIRQEALLVKIGVLN